MRENSVSRRQLFVIVGASTIAAAGANVGPLRLYSRNPRITISALTVSEQAPPGSLVGLVSVLAGNGAYTLRIPIGGDPDAKFLLNGANLLTADTFDFETVPFHRLTLEADNGVDPILTRTVLISVVDAFEQPDLTELSLPETVAQGAAIAITGARPGSSISAPILPIGWTLDSINQEILIAPDAPLGPQEWALIETLSESQNSPQLTRGTSTVVEAGAFERPFVVIAIMGQSNAQGTATAGIQDTDVDGIAQFHGNPSAANIDTISSDIVPLDHPRPGATPNNIGVGDYFVRQLYLNGYVDPQAHRILIVPCARGATGMITGGQEWRPTAPLGELMQNALDQSTQAVAAAQAINPDSHFAGFLWCQGENETNNNGDKSAYQSAFVQLLSLMRSNVPTASNCWAMISSMVPEWLRSRNMTAPIHDAHMTLAFENDGVYFDQAPTGLEDNAVNIIHYDAEGFRTYGAQLADALPDLIADDRLVYDFRGQETGDGATRNSNELLGTYQLGSRRFTLQSGAGIGLSDRCISPSGASVLNSPSAAAIQFTPTLGSSDIAVEWKANLAGRQWITLRGGNGEGAPFGFFGYDGYLFRVDASNTVSLFNINGQTVAANLVVNAAMGVVGSTALFRASAIGTRLRFEVSNNQGTSWTTVIDVSDAVHSGGRAVYMQGGNGTTGGMIFADTFVLRKQLPVF